MRCGCASGRWPSARNSVVVVGGQQARTDTWGVRVNLKICLLAGLVCASCGGAGGPPAASQQSKAIGRLAVPGTGCQTTNDCDPGLFCTDGVCCNLAACPVCQTCNGSSPGICTVAPAGTACAD